MTSLSAAVYVRISDDREGAGLGVERQEKDCRALASSLGWDVADVYIDNDLTASGKNGKRARRPAYDRLLADLDAGRVDGLVVWHNDRLHRSARELEDFIDVVEKAGAAVQTVRAGRYDLTTATGRMTARIVGAVAQYESEHKSDRVRAKYVQLAEAGEVGNGGFRPFGYSADRRTLNEDEAVVLREVYEQVVSGRSLRSIVADLHDRGVTTSTGRPWSQQGLRYNLLSGRNAGLREHQGRVVGPAVWPAIVDASTYETVRTLLLEPGRTAGHVGARKYLLTGYLACGLCGEQLRPVRTSQTQRFGCRKAPGSPACGSILVRYEPAEAAVVALLMAKAEQVDVTPRDTTDIEVDRLETAIALDEERLTALADAYADDPGGDFLELRRAGATIRKRIDRNRSELAKLRQTARLLPDLDVRRLWPAYDLAQRRAVLDVFIERVDVGSARRGRNTFDPERLSVVWR